jgi:hypothetical protein
MVCLGLAAIGYGHVPTRVEEEHQANDQTQ